MRVDRLSRDKLDFETTTSTIGLMKISFVDRVRSLKNNRETIKPCSGIDAFERQLCEHSVFTEIVLHEYTSIPDLQETTAFTVRSARWFTAPVVFLAIEENFSAGSAWSGSTSWSPEVRISAETDDSLARNQPFLHFLRFINWRYGGQLVVASVDRDIDSRSVELEDLADHLPSQLDCFTLEVVADRPIAHHLEESEMVPVADAFNVISPHALLNVTKTLARRNLLASEKWLERSHSGIDEK